MAVADAAEATHSPVLMGFSGIYLPHEDRAVKEHLSTYAHMGLDVCRHLSVPAALVFNESPHHEWVLEAIDLGFGLVMYTDERIKPQEQMKRVREIVETAHRANVAVEGEASPLPGVGGELADLPQDMRLTDPDNACQFVEQTGVDAFAVNVGQAHLHGRREVRLDLDRVAALHNALPVPPVMHGASSVHRDDVVEAIRLGIRKINVGSILKRVYFESLRQNVALVDGDSCNPYEVVGSGLEADVLVSSRLALQETVEDLMRLFGSAGQT
jgi:fructose/tagatose bisphosphate aldolase